MKSKQKRVSSLWTRALEDVKKRHTNSSPFECYEANTYTYRRALFASFSRKAKRVFLWGRVALCLFWQVVQSEVLKFAQYDTLNYTTPLKD